MSNSSNSNNRIEDLTVVKVPDLLVQNEAKSPCVKCLICTNSCSAGLLFELNGINQDTGDIDLSLNIPL